ncbi:unnamed protein product [Caenorhabditis bovis]|uniref:FAST kinase leucine-rich domain-containing protein n=1 Tax=Caenorhabditis bovis TaxID=2654633 RepID=A0A8S1F2H7_9PELO|nr:unnamed protein product [Caenorhabditis bovis]
MLNHSLTVQHTAICQFRGMAAVVAKKNLGIEEFAIEELNSVPFENLMMLLTHSDKLEPILMERIIEHIEKRVKNELDKPSELLTLLNHTPKEVWFDKSHVVQKCEQLAPYMNLGEQCALLKHLAVRKQRNKLLMRILANFISESPNCLSVSQIVTVVTACSTLSFYSEKLLRKVSNDIAMNSNVIRKWSDVIQITDSFVRMRYGKEKTWSTLIRWATQNESEASIDELGRFVTVLARIGVSDGKPLARIMKKKLNRYKVRLPATWLNAVYSLAYFQELDAVIVDSVLNKSFVQQIMENSHEKIDRLRKAMTLLMINKCARVDLPSYDGPTVSREFFEQFGIQFGPESIKHAIQLKYTHKNTEHTELFLKNLFKIAPQDTHCRHADIEKCGVLVDGYVLPDPNKIDRLVSVNQWGDRKPRPILFFGWMHTKQEIESNGESALLGPDQLGLRLLRAQGYDPIVVFKSEFDFCANDLEKLNLLREKIHGKL